MLLMPELPQSKWWALKYFVMTQGPAVVLSMPSSLLPSKRTHKCEGESAFPGGQADVTPVRLHRMVRVGERTPDENRDLAGCG